jgi:hypothetical protein
MLSFYDLNYMKKQRERSLLRKYVRSFYLKNINKFVLGKAIDFGCGVGTLLKLLPPGSLGYEINRAAVDFCKTAGMNVKYYDIKDDYRFIYLKKTVIKPLL